MYVPDVVKNCIRSRYNAREYCLLWLRQMNRKLFQGAGGFGLKISITHPAVFKITSL